MQSVLPGQPQAQLHALDYGFRGEQLIVTYISGSTCVVADGPHNVLQILSPATTDRHGLVAVKVHLQSTRIAVASSTQCWIYGVTEEVKDKPRWVQELDIHISNETGDIRTLSWGSDDELLVGTTQSLVLYSTHLSSHPTSPIRTDIQTPSVHAVWSRDVPSPVSYADLSPSGFVISTLSQYDRMVKVWRRLSFETPEFDYAYLRHPDVVTHVEWRQSRKQKEYLGREEDVLYTLCSDGVFRVWRPSGQHGADILSLFAKLDTRNAIQPQVEVGSADSRFVFVINSDIVEDLAKDSLANPAPLVDPRSEHGREYLKEIVSRSPDVIIVADCHGHMSAWGLESVGCKRRTNIESNAIGHPFHICQHEKVDMTCSASSSGVDANIRTLAIPISSSGGELAVLSHHFDGRIAWQQTKLQDLLDPGVKKERLPLLATWTGHESSIKKVRRNAAGSALVSRTENNDVIVWRASNSTLMRGSKLDIQDHIHRAVLLGDGSFLVCLHHDKVTLWDCQSQSACRIATCSYDLSHEPLCLLLLPRVDAANQCYHLASVDESMSGQVWEVLLTQDVTSADHQASMRSFCKFNLTPVEDAVHILPVDPAGNPAIASDFLDIFAHDVAMSYSASGKLTTYTARMNGPGHSVEFLVTSTVETGLHNPSLGSATSIRRAALVDEMRRRLTIWDTRSGRLDHDETFEEPVNDLDWAATAGGQSILAVGFARSVHVYAQLRYDYISDRPAWARMKIVTLPEWTLSSIADSVWLASGRLVIGTGNQLLLSTDDVDVRKDLAPDLHISIPHKRASRLDELVDRSNGPLPVFHPQFISQCVLAGKLSIASVILTKLLEVLKFYTEGDDLDPMLGLEVDAFTGDQNTMNTGISDMNGSAVFISAKSITTQMAEVLNGLLTQKSVPQLTSSEQLSLVSITECVATVSENSRSIDDNASRYLLAWRATQLREYHNKVAGISWREATFAYHSSSQDILSSLVLSSAPKGLSWDLAKRSRLFTWLTSREALLQHFEDLARNVYTATDPKDPVACSLHYLALRKKQVLVGLWRIATWSREQGATMRLLRNDFTDARWRTAAQKNAFALMGRRRFEYAAAFFLLSDDLKSALGVLANQMADVDLAIAVGRIYGGDDCQELQDLIMERVLRPAIRSGDRWSATWALWFLGQRSNAVRSLVTPLEKLLLQYGTQDPDDDQPKLSLRAKSFLNDDPALVILYDELRSKSLQTLRGALMVEGQDESRFIIRTAGLWRRMGCDLLALDLVKNWEFLQTEQTRAEMVKQREQSESLGELPPSPSLNRDFDPRKLLRRRSSLVVDDLSEPLRTPTTPKVASMLDGFSLSVDQGHSAGTRSAARSVLDQFQDRPTAPAHPRSILEDFDFDDSGGGSSPKAETRKRSPEQADTIKTDMKKEPTQIKEDVGSILDNFDF